MAGGFHSLTLRDVRREPGDAVLLSFDVPTELAETFAFEAGQYLTLRARIDGKDTRRSYSIACAPGDGLSVGVKRVPGGAFSEFAMGLQAGDTLDVMAPMGRFTRKSARNLLLIAAGSGVTPMVGLAAEALAEGGDVTLILGNRYASGVMLGEDMQRLKDRYLGRFTLIHVLSRDTGEAPITSGRIDAEKVQALTDARLINPHAADGVFFCGPGDMIETGRAALTSMGVPEDRLHDERFTPASGATSKRTPAPPPKGAEVEIILDGARLTVPITDQTVLDAAAARGLELPYSCAGGMCSTCRCKVVEGKATMDVNYSLEPWETKAGFVLACQARPVGKRLVLDFDAM
ncbi:2Fe-2S iron-sulfur cluster-binding protein [Shimia ponticola]|uniref:2Fe-2S iron-sulfur cluster-binding protein n=1 Tax=Shimia ponticola TaxID=2582893 RepID=UPI0011BD999C|nr:2Fe-2S iron-sulfur cluster-binding protein [Shimia ponticola]